MSKALRKYLKWFSILVAWAVFTHVVDAPLWVTGVGAAGIGAAWSGGRP